MDIREKCQNICCYLAIFEEKGLNRLGFTNFNQFYKFASKLIKCDQNIIKRYKNIFSIIKRDEYKGIYTVDDEDYYFYKNAKKLGYEQFTQVVMEVLMSDLGEIVFKK